MSQTLELDTIDKAKTGLTNGVTSRLVIEVQNNGSSSRWATYFPSLTRDQLEEMENRGVLVIDHTYRAKAIAAFEKLTADIADLPFGIMVGTISFVSLPCGGESEYDVVTWDLYDYTRPVWGRQGWKDEFILSRD